MAFKDSWAFNFDDRKGRLSAVMALRRQSQAVTAAYIVLDRKELEKVRMDDVPLVEVLWMYVGRARRLPARMAQLVSGTWGCGIARHGFTKRLLASEGLVCSVDDLAVIVVPAPAPADLEARLFWAYVGAHDAYPVGNLRPPDRSRSG